jgi:O-antigen/teichoic acid export membrane protein
VQRYQTPGIHTSLRQYPHPLSPFSRLPNLKTLQKWLLFAGKPAGVTIILSVTTLAANVLIFRLLTPAQAGQFSLLVAIAQTLAIVAGLGQSTVLRRFYSHSLPGHYDWFADLFQTLALTLPVILAGSFVVYYLYALDLWQAAFVCIVSLGINTIALLGHIYSSQQHYVWGSVLVRLPFNILLAGMLPMLVLPQSSRFIYLTVTFSIILGAVLLFGLIAALRKMPRGSARLTQNERRWGASFLISGLTYQLPEEGLFSIAGLLVSPAQLAAVAAFTLLLRPFGLLYDTLNQLLITELGRRPQTWLRPMALALFGLAIGTGIVVMLAAPIVSDGLYGGQFNSYLFLVPFLVTGAALQLAEVLGRTYITVMANHRTLFRFVTMNVLIAVLGTGLAIALIVRTGIIGLALGIIAIYLCRNLVTYSLSLTVKRSGASSPLPSATPQ